MNGNGFVALLVALLVGSLMPCAGVSAATDKVTNADAGAPLDFAALIYAQAYLASQDLAQSALNPNNVLAIPSTQAEVEIRPDFLLSNDFIELVFKPRFVVTRRDWSEGLLDGTSDSESDAYVQEGYARVRLNDSFFVSYGRENLQWGPSYLLSPSNIFNVENGRNSPQAEVPGMEYARMVWIPDNTWSLSLIANTGKGRSDQVDFKKVYALKIDYTNEHKYFSLIPSYQDDGDASLGYLAGWTATDALLLYFEGRAGEGNSDQFLLGGTYTLEGGSAIAMEFFHNSEGCTNSSVVVCYTPGNTPAANAYVRKNYLMLQYLDTALYDDIDLTVRYIHGLDDDSSRLIGILEYELGQNAKLFAVGNLFHGDSKTEFGSLLNHSILVGVGYTF